jgi:TolA-binding protein
MKTVVSTLVALLVLAGITAPVSAFDAKSFYEQQDRISGGSTQASDIKTLFEQIDRERS